jgi:hypothetical protein
MNDNTTTKAPEAIPVLDEAPKTNTPPYMVVGNSFVAQTPEGEISIPLFFKTKTIRQMPDSLDDVEMLYYLVGEESPTAKILDELDLQQTRDISRRLSQAYAEKHAASLGK